MPIEWPLMKGECHPKLWMNEETRKLPYENRKRLITRLVHHWYHRM